MNFLAGQCLNQFLAELPHLDAFAGQVFMLKCNCAYIPLLDRRIQAEQQVGRGKIEEM